MTLAAQIDPASPDVDLRDASRALASRRPIVAGLLLSLLLHVVFGLLVIEFPARDDAALREIVIPVELLAEPPSPPAPVPKTPPQAQVPPEPPARPPEPKAEPAPQPPIAPPQIIQRETAPNAARSSAPRPQPPRATAPTATPKPVPVRPAESPDGLQPAAPPVEKRPALGVSTGRTTDIGPAGPAGEKLAQSDVDYLLAQVLRVWLIDFRSPRFKDIVISGNFQLNPDGTLGAPFGVNDPWAPERMVSNYSELLRPEARDQRTALESFLAAMRQAQPFRRQPDAVPLTGPRIMSFSFRLGDL
ncbi:MAG: hypothetical protein JNN22_06060 [Rhodospirillales bacterium]|nr:hypothetical protein [Rhodospirillales bacterium]